MPPTFLSTLETVFLPYLNMFICPRWLINYFPYRIPAQIHSLWPVKVGLSKSGIIIHVPAMFGVHAPRDSVRCVPIRW